MTSRTSLPALLCMLGSLLSLSCQQSPETPIESDAEPVPVAYTDIRTGSALPMGLYSATIDLRDGELAASIKPMPAATRSALVIGDLLALEVAQYFQSDPCVDCFGVKALGRDLDGNLFIDLFMRHPFRTTDAREDLDVFDPRVLIITDQDAIAYPALDPVLGGIDGTVTQTVEVQPDLVLNADGYTSHYDWIAEHPEIVGVPRSYDGTINPYIDFFTEIDPDPEVEGTPIANRRMSMASQNDVRRITLSTAALAARGNQFEALLLIEVSYGQPAIRAIPTGSPGSRKDPVYFLPAFNRKEAVELNADPIAPWTAGSVELRDLDIAIADWQAGEIGVGEDNYAVAPDYLGLGDIPYTSTLESVHFSLPALDPTLKTETSFPLGDGTLSLPWTASLAVSNTLNPPAGIYYGVLSAVDSYHGTQAVPGFAYGGVQSYIRDFTTYQIVPVTVDPGTPNDPPVAQFKARKQGDVAWTDAPGLLTITAGDTVEYTLVDSTDDLNSWALVAAHYDLDGSAGTGSNGGFETIQLSTSTIGTIAYPAATSLTLRAKCRDNLSQFSAEESLTLQVNAAPNNAPVASLKARKQGDTTWTVAPGPLNVSVGDTVEYTLADSTDDLGLWSNPAAYYDVDGNSGNGFETTGTLISTIVTRLYSTNGTITASAKVRDNAPQDSATVTMTVNVSGGTPTCYTVTPIANLPMRIYEHGADTLNGKIYVAGGWSPDFGGNNRVNLMWEYDPALNTYTQLPGTFTGFQAGQGRSGLEVLALNNRIYCIGGEGTFVATCSFNYNPTSYFDLGSSTFSNGTNLNPSLWRAAGAVWNNRLWMPGGFREWNETTCGAFTNSVNTTTVYNPSTNAWTNLNDFGSAIPTFTDRKWAHGVAVLNSKLYVLPGQYETAGGAQGYARTVAEYDLTTAGATWIAKDLAPAHRWLYEVEVVNNRAYIIGGLNDAGTTQSTIYQFDPTLAAGSQWSTLSTACGTLPNPVYGAASAVHNGEIYVFGGRQILSNPPLNACYKITLQ